MISYYDIRAAQNAMRALQSKPLRRRMLDIHYSIPKVGGRVLYVHMGICYIPSFLSYSPPVVELITFMFH